MLARIAKVVWWLGLLLALLGAYFCITQAYERQGCAAASQLQLAIASNREAAIDRYINAHPAPLHDTSDHLLAMLDAAANIPPDLRDTPEHQKQVVFCQGSDGTILVLVIAGVFALVLWSIAYVLGGSFWLPSKRRT